MKFSVLLSIYHKEKPEIFHDAMRSIWDDQSLRPNEIVIVKDGPLTDILDEAINEWFIKLSDVLKIVTITNNSGLGIALSEGLEHCIYEIVARMDTDDISHPERFKKQIEYMLLNPEVDIIGGWIAEFKYDLLKINAYRKLPINHDEIIRFAKRRSPLNHMTVMFKKKSVIDCGSYKSAIGFEDYHLWSRMIMSDKKFANLPECLVFARTGNGMLSRRRGWEYIKNEYRLQKFFYEIGFINFFNLIINVSLRTLIRLLPEFFLGYFYRLILRNN